MSQARDVLSPPEHLSSGHDVAQFDSGVPALDDWLRKRALQNELTGASRTYVICQRATVVGYYALATGAVAQQQATGSCAAKHARADSRDDSRPLGD